MAEGAVDVTVEAAPDEVWAKVGDFGGVADFFPGIESFRLEGDDRVIGMFGMEIRERLLARDDAEPHADLLGGRRRAAREPHGHHLGRCPRARAPG